MPLIESCMLYELWLTSLIMDPGQNSYIQCHQFKIWHHEEILYLFLKIMKGNISQFNIVQFFDF